jgi:hypothetical protein
MDNYFTSVTLFEKLLGMGFYAVGTARSDRKHFPRELVGCLEGLARGKWEWRQLAGSPLTVVSWMDSKPVHLLSTCSDPRQQTTVRRWTGEEQASVSCPEVLPLYIKAMRGVDVFSQRQSYSKLGRRSRKWYYSIVWFLVDVAIHNAFVLYQNKHQQKNFEQKDFRKALMEQLVGAYSSRKAAAASPKRPRDSLHAIIQYSTPRACVQCRGRVKQGGNNRRTRFGCEDCNQALCLPVCYNKHIASCTQHSDE